MLEGRTYDLVTMIQVLPHFYDLHQALQSAADVTKPQGYWLIETWNRDSMSAKLFGSEWHEYKGCFILNFDILCIHENAPFQASAIFVFDG